MYLHLLPTLAQVQAIIDRVNAQEVIKNHADGNWKGFNGDDLIATIDLGEIKSLKVLNIHLSDLISPIFLLYIFPIQIYKIFIKNRLQ